MHEIFAFTVVEEETYLLIFVKLFVSPDLKRHNEIVFLCFQVLYQCVNAHFESCINHKLKHARNNFDKNSS